MNRSWLRRRREIFQAEEIGLASGTKQVVFRVEKEQTEEGAVADVVSEEGRSRAWDFALSPRIQEPLKGSILRLVGR